MHRIALSLNLAGARRLANLALACAVLAGSAGCVSGPAAEHNRYDLGDPPASRADAGGRPLRATPLVVPDVRAPEDLDSDLIYYRLRYRSDLESRSYTSSNWTMPPGQLLTQRLRSRLTEQGVLVSTLGSTGAPVLRIDLLKFEQVFDQVAVGRGVVELRATLMRDGVVLVQRDFEAQAPSPTADAAGGAQALAHATDALLASLLGWLAAQPLK